MNSFNGCCVCLQCERELRLVYIPRKEDDVAPNEMLHQITGIRIEDCCDAADLIPNQICQKCETSLIQAYTFQKQARRAQKQIIENCNQTDFQQITKSKGDDLMYLNEDIIVCGGQYEERNYDPLSEVSSVSTKLKKNIERSSQNCNITAKEKFKKNKRTVKSKLKQKLRPNENTNHICETCGNIYFKRSCLLEHRKRHNKELLYACEFCDKRFNMRELLRRHIITHSGTKPYKCAHCSRTFFYVSAKNAHEVVHTGIKPHKCTTCNKAFAYAHSLTKHQLIHAEIKLHYCNYCDKEFRLQHHMKQHEETKSHKKALAEAGHKTAKEHCKSVIV